MTSLELLQIYHLKEMSFSAELFLSCSILQFTFYAINTAYKRKSGFTVLNQQVYFICILLVTLSFFLILNEDLVVISSFTSNNSIINDYFSFTSKLFICLASILFLIIVNVSLKDKQTQNNFEYVTLITISILGLLLLCSANDLITAYLAIELHSIASYIMAAFKRKSSYSIESSLKYFIIGALSSALFLFGSSVTYGCMGSLNFDDLQMFFSLLYSYDSQVSPAIILYSLKNSSNSEVALGSYDLAYGKSLFGFIGISFANSDLDLIQSIVVNNEDNLINWCNITKFNNALLFSTSLVNIVTWFSVSVSVKDSWLLFQFSTDFLMTEFHYFFHSNIWSNLLISNIIELNQKLLLIKHIFISYANAEIIKAIKNLSMLDTNLISIGFIIICVSLFIKLSISPFHFWSLDVYEGSPNSTTFFFSVVPKIALFVLLTKICYISFYQIFIEKFQTYFFLFAILSIFVGSLGGLEQRKLKTLIAYSSISHTGYLLLVFSAGNLEGMQMLFYYLIIYMLSGLVFWSIYLFLRQKRSFYFVKSNKELGDLTLLKKSNSMLALVLAITLFSISGIPPIVGFLAKIGIFLVLVKSSAYSITFGGILFSLVSTFYYVRLIKVLYFEKMLVGKLYKPIVTKKSLLISTLAILLIVLCVDPIIVYLLFYKSILLI